jgi:hypothetical protein
MIEIIEQSVLSVFKIEKQDFDDNIHRRLTPYKNARFYIWLFAKIFGYSYMGLSRIYPKTHAAILHGVNRILDYSERYVEYKALFEQIEGVLEDKGYVLSPGWRERVAKHPVDNFLKKH